MALKPVNTTMTQILRGWHDFLLMGTMTATLVGLSLRLRLGLYP